jgi:hypothetical protein
VCEGCEGIQMISRPYLGAKKLEWMGRVCLTSTQTYPPKRGFPILRETGACARPV